ncbi:hotdog fold thioesterase [Thalassobius vesicularis]|uniref:Hotdog fold thioesterase n=1 Tax=Thalassobius vesicularis TaxID=1294297 RepID=A0A4S3M6F6_9RHOB|nr:hotdog fold thioesterase [Thalassobius vesicularis]THD72650.1 hotdog fold thioesterase [Thalassobius vesicularis]
MTETIWKSPISLELVNKLGTNCCNGYMGIEVIEVGPDFLQARMPVDHRTKQPMGLLHGGASVVLAETLASIGANFVLDRRDQACVGQEINANHLRSATEGWVYGTSRPVHIGRRTQVWETHITDEADRLVCISRMTLAVIDRPKED